MTQNSDNRDTAGLLSMIRSVIGSIYQLVDFVGRSPYAITMALILIMNLPIPLASEFFTELQITIKMITSMGVGTLSLTIREILDVGVTDVVSRIVNIYIVSFSMTCSICASVYFAMFSFMAWWIAMTFSTSLQQSLEGTCVKFCEITGGSKIWRLSNICSIPAILTVILVGYWGIEIVYFFVSFAWLAINWQSHIHDIEIDRWIHQLLSVDERKLQIWYFIFVY